jgi:hypothetical protein
MVPVVVLSALIEPHLATVSRRGASSSARRRPGRSSARLAGIDDPAKVCRMMIEDPGGVCRVMTE